MAKNKEAKSVAKIHRHIPDYVYFQSLYTPYVGGTPDYFYSGIEDCLFVEYKYQDRIPKKIHLCNPDIKHPPLSAKQQQWLRGRYNEGRNVAVVYATPDGAVALENLAWEYPMDREVFLAKALSPKDIAAWITWKVSIKQHLTATKEVLPL